MYYCFLVNSTTGAIGANSSTHSPTISVTTTNPDGTTTTTNEFDPNLIPAGCVVLGPFETLDATQQAVFDNPALYLYQGGKFVDNPNAGQILLQSAKEAKISKINQDYYKTLNTGFSSLANGTSIVYGFTDADQTNIAQELNIVNAGIATFPIYWGAKDGTVVSLDEVQFKQLCKDANGFKWAQVGKLRTLIPQVQAATTIDAVKAIVW